MGVTYSCAHAAALLAHMPRGSALGRAVDPSQEWTQTDYLLRLIEHDLRCIAWQLSGGKGKPKPKPVPSPAEEAARSSRISRETPEKRARVDSILKREQGAHNAR